jgi:hypothetical protein
MKAADHKANANSRIRRYFYDNSFAGLFRTLLLMDFAAIIFYQIY